MAKLTIKLDVECRDKKQALDRILSLKPVLMGWTENEAAADEQ